MDIAWHENSFFFNTKQSEHQANLAEQEISVAKIDIHNIELMNPTPATKIWYLGLTEVELALESGSELMTSLSVITHE